ncbi:MAG: hypothetical protein EZS28_024632, partial [Streblomastix strix]
TIDGKIMKGTNTRLGQKDGVMSKLQLNKNGLTGIHTKMILLPNSQLAAPFIHQLSATDYRDLQPSINADE